MTTTSSLFRDYFGQLEGLHCWQVSSELGTWLSLSFGQPHVRVREDNPHGKSERLRRRHAYVEGDFFLWFEMGEWEYYEKGKRRYHSGQSRAYLRRTAARLQSQCIARVQLVEQPAKMVFDFDLGGQLLVRPASDAAQDDPLWHLYAHDRCLTLLANVTLEHGESNNNKPARLKARPATYMPNPALKPTDNGGAVGVGLASR